MDRTMRVATGAIAWAVALGLSSTGTAALQSPARGSQGQARNFVVLGCVSREAPSPTAGRGGQAASPFILTDTRATPPARYRLDGSVEQLQLHVGHTLEVAGPLTAAAPGGGATMPTVKVQSVTYISASCTK